MHERLIFGGRYFGKYSSPMDRFPPVRSTLQQGGPRKTSYFRRVGWKITPLFRSWSNHRHPFISPFIGVQITPFMAGRGPPSKTFNLQPTLTNVWWRHDVNQTSFFFTTWNVFFVFGTGWWICVCVFIFVRCPKTLWKSKSWKHKGTPPKATPRKRG